MKLGTLVHHVHYKIFAKDFLTFAQGLTVKSCIKAAAYVQFFNILVQLLFKCGFYSRAAMQCSWSAKPVKAVWHDVALTLKAKLDFVMVTAAFQNVNKQFSMQTAMEISLTWTMFGRNFQAAASI